MAPIFFRKPFLHQNQLRTYVIQQAMPIFSKQVIHKSLDAIAKIELILNVLLQTSLLVCNKVLINFQRSQNKR